MIQRYGTVYLGVLYGETIGLWQLDFAILSIHES